MIYTTMEIKVSTFEKKLSMFKLALKEWDQLLAVSKPKNEALNATI